MPAWELVLAWAENQRGATTGEVNGNAETDIGGSTDDNGDDSGENSPCFDRIA